MTNKYLIIAPHKSGSTIFQRILRDITTSRTPEAETKSKPAHFVLKTDDREIEIEFTRHLNFIDTRDTATSLVLFTRNPLATCISMYYSFGYTHGKPDHMTDEFFKKWRDNIVNSTLEQYVESKLRVQVKKLNTILDPKLNDKLVLSYELMITNFGECLKQFLDYIQMPQLYESTYKRWNKEFNKIEDRSDEIVKGGLKVHKRTTDIHEWRKKLSPEFIDKMLHQYPAIRKYIEHIDREVVGEGRQ